jgi:hypothetical protein
MEVTVLHLSVSLPHLISGTFWFSLGSIPQWVAGDGPWFGEPGPYGEGRRRERRFRSRANFSAAAPGNIGLSRCRRKFLPRNRLKRRSRLLASLTVDRRTAGRSYGLHGARSRSETDVSQRRQRQRSQTQGPLEICGQDGFAVPQHPQHLGRRGGLGVLTNEYLDRASWVRRRPSDKTGGRGGTTRPGRGRVGSPYQRPSVLPIRFQH